MENKIIPCLWFDNRIEEAVAFYTATFKNGKTEVVTRYVEDSMMPKGSVLTVSFRIANQDFIALNGGPYFKFTPATSFFVGCETVEEFDKLWAQLSDGGMVLMEPGSYPFSEKFGWLQDKFGLSWQLAVCGIPQYITPFLLFVGQQGKAEEAAKFYCSVFTPSEITSMELFGKDEGQVEGTVKHAEFSLTGQDFMSMDGGPDHQFTFSEAVSFYVYCNTQDEIDRFWNTLSANGEEQPCGWLKDRFGVSWQIVPYNIEKMISDKDTSKVKRMMQAMMQMKKIDMGVLQKAFDE